MKLTIIGIQVMDFVGQDGRQVSGVKLFGTYESRGVQGLACDSVFLRDTEVVPSIGDKIVLYYNKRGRLTGWDIAE